MKKVLTCMLMGLFALTAFAAGGDVEVVDLGDGHGMVRVNPSQKYLILPVEDTAPDSPGCQQGGLYGALRRVEVCRQACGAAFCHECFGEGRGSPIGEVGCFLLSIDAVEQLRCIES